MLFEINQEACVACLACVRVCPTTAIEADEARLTIAQDSCVRCGMCLPACDHGAVELRGDLYTALTDAVMGEAVLILGVEAEVFFYPAVPEQLINAAHRAGFRWVYRGVIGDELVAGEYRKLWKSMSSGTMIRSTCPVVIETIRRDYPILAQFLAPVKTPLAAEVSYVRARHGEKIRIVYAGACVPGDDAGVDASITLPELAELFRIRRVVV
ncbi:MAG: 4Fe-4S binding protein, partial [Gemmatimonadota bacterium]|nr:4Fe-4S binding protein [Gemmatimonadota bacterium]